MYFGLNSIFNIGEISRKEFEKLISDIIIKEIPGIVIFDFSYSDKSIKAQTSQGEIEIDIDWDEIIIKE